MKSYANMTKEELVSEREVLLKKYNEFCSKNLKLDMSRGKPSSKQLNVSNEIFDIINSKSDFIAEDGIDTRNYGDLYGIEEAKKYFADVLDVDKDMVMAGGSSSLNLEYNLLAGAMIYGIHGCTPWKDLKEVKFLCPSPGYDRHFAITEHMGIKMIYVPYNDCELDIDMIEKLVADDESIKGMWCVPKYENPLGITFSDELVKRLAKINPKAKDFILIWDNAYFIHDIYEDKKDTLYNIFDAIKGTKNEDMVYSFTSTSKITIAGGGVSAMITSKKNLKKKKKDITVSIISYDKVNMLRHVKFLKNKENTIEHMKKHAAFLRPKFDLVKQIFSTELDGLEIAKWTKPNGGYFITFWTLNNLAKKVYERCKKAGVVLTQVGAAFPYGIDPNDNCIRIAPSYPELDELENAANLFCICVKLESIEYYLNK